MTDRHAATAKVPSPDGDSLRDLILGFSAALVFALAFLSPVEYVDSDPGIALLATQSLIDHGTLSLDDYASDPACAYDLEHDYRVQRRNGSLHYFSHGVSLLSLPAVWLSNRAGYHMLDRNQEQALQNLLSAICCALLAWLLYRICRVYLQPRASFVIAAVSLLGSSLTSTLATGLWNAGYESLLLALGLLHLARRSQAEEAPRWTYLAMLAALAFLCRPTAAFAVLGAAVALAPSVALRRKSTWFLAASAALLVAVVIGLDAAEMFPRYYSPLKLTPATPLLHGLNGVLLSPSRGLLLFSPFLLLVVAGSLRYLPELARSRLFRLSAAWAVFQVLAVATKGVWWGGHSYGPRLLTEVMLPAVVLTCLVWKQHEGRAGRRSQLLVATGYLVLGLGAVAIHSYQGLFNPYTRLWNSSPDIDLHPETAFDWHHPQFLASATSIDERRLDQERLDLETYALGEELTCDSDDAIFRDWYVPEDSWRWSRGTSAEIIMRLGDLPNRPLYLWWLRAGTLGAQTVDLEVNGKAVGQIELEGHLGRERVFAFGRELLRPGAENRFRFDLPQATSPAEDSRQLGLALYAFALRPVASDFSGIGFEDDPFFASGFSRAEQGWRWTDGHRAVVDYPVAAGDLPATLELAAAALEDQSVEIRLNGIALGELDFPAGFMVVRRQLVFDPSLVLPSRINRIELVLPGAMRVSDDSRLLGIAFVRLVLGRED